MGASVGATVVILGSGFGDVGEARQSSNRMVNGITRVKQIVDRVEGDPTNSEKYIKELSKVCWEIFRATGAMFEQEHLRFSNMCAAAGSGEPVEKVTGTPRAS